jgi:predicted transcriptional regulator
MLEALLGSAKKENVLIFIECRGKGYAREIAKFYNIPLTPVQSQLKNLEAGGVIYGVYEGKTLIYRFNPRYPFIAELRTLLNKVIEFYPEEIKRELLYDRKRPRRTGKPI